VHERSKRDKKQKMLHSRHKTRAAQSLKVLIICCWIQMLILLFLLAVTVVAP
jgi:hypothetical protein